MAFRRGKNNHFGCKVELKLVKADGSVEESAFNVCFKRPTQKDIEGGEFEEIKRSKMIGKYFVSADFENEDGQKIKDQPEQLAVINDYPEVSIAICDGFFRGMFPNEGGGKIPKSKGRRTALGKAIETAIS
ncbi:MAG: hypothetical protein GY862_12530 [Gammaproteobacteria bacterium]|nr:hypothetical protein [Gammaproteobacteria bacterium]